MRQKLSLEEIQVEVEVTLGRSELEEVTELRGMNKVRIYSVGGSSEVGVVQGHIERLPTWLCGSLILITQSAANQKCLLKHIVYDIKKS